METRRITGALGATIDGVDLSAPLDAGEVAALRAAMDAFGVLVFRNQRLLSAEEHLALAAQFGEIETPPLLTSQSEHPQVLIVEFERPKGSGADVWHTDGSYLEHPPRGTFLQAHVLPDHGGDTCFSSMYAAYEALSAPMQAMLEGLTASHSSARLVAQTGSRGQYDPALAKVPPPVSHPLVTVNPATGRRRLFCNSLYTQAIDGLAPAESDALLRFLFEHIKSPEFQLRVTWSVGDVVFWDNLAVQHYAVADYDQRRRMQRVTLLGTRPLAAQAAIRP